jgi:tetratricopeptide (TPR) repeat protein
MPERLYIDQLRQQARADKSGWQKHHKHVSLAGFGFALIAILYVLTLPMGVQLSTLQKVILITLVALAILAGFLSLIFVNPLSPFNPLKPRIKRWKNFQQLPFDAGNSLLKEEYESALVQLNSVNRWVSYSVGTQLNAQKLLNAEHFDEAINEYRRIAAMAWRDGQGHLIIQALGNLGLALITAERYAEARPFLEIALTITPAEGALWGNLAIAHMELKDFSEYVLTLLDTTIERFGKPKGSVVTNALLMSKARVLAEMKRTQEAEAHYQEALTFTKPPSPSEKGISLFVAGNVRLALNDKVGAASNFKQALALYPNDKFGQRVQKSLNELENSSS